MSALTLDAIISLVLAACSKLTRADAESIARVVVDALGGDRAQDVDAAVDVAPSFQSQLDALRLELRDEAQRDAAANVDRPTPVEARKSVV